MQAVTRAEGGMAGRNDPVPSLLQVPAPGGQPQRWKPEKGTFLFGVFKAVGLPGPRGQKSRTCKLQGVMRGPGGLRVPRLPRTVPGGPAPS